MSELSHTQNINIKVNAYGTESGLATRIDKLETIVYLDHEEISHHLQSIYSYNKSESQIDKFTKHILTLREQAKSTQNSRTNRGNFVYILKMVWFKFRAKVFNLKL